MARVAQPPSAPSPPTVTGDPGPTPAGSGLAGRSLSTARLRPRWVPAGVAAVVVAMALGLGVGPARLDVVDVARALLGLPTGMNDQERAIVVDIRLPRVVLGLLVGAMLSLAGASYQGVFRNPLADPYLLGAASGAGLGVTIAVVTRASGATIPVSALSPPLRAHSWRWRSPTCSALPAPGGCRPPPSSWPAAAPPAAPSGHHPPGVLLHPRRHLHRRVARGGHRPALPRLATVVLLSQRRTLDVLALGDDEATSLGLHARRSRLVVVVAASLGTAAAVSVSGLIGFVGIIVPHTIRLLAGASHRAGCCRCRCCSGPSWSWPTSWPARWPRPPRSPSGWSPPSSVRPSSCWCFVPRSA